LVLLLAVVVVAFVGADPSKIATDIQKLSPAVLVAAFVALVTNAIAAAWRFRVITKNLGHRISFRQALAAVSGGSLAGAAFFQIAGQLIARGAILGKGGIPFSSTIAITASERAAAALTSIVLAIAGGYFIFGQIIIDYTKGGAELGKILLGIVAATIAGYRLAYGRLTNQSLASMLSAKFARRAGFIIGLSLIVQIPMMAAYVLIASALAPNIPIASLIAATAIVMFAASVPISLAGWGVRELSAVLALSAVGMSVGNALITSIAVGLGSLLAMAIIALVSIGVRQKPAPSVPSAMDTMDFNTVLAWLIPLAAATLVLFHVHIPIASGTKLNVNLADPFAILGGALFVLTYFQRRALPAWQLPHVNAAIAACTFVITYSLLIGIGHLGVTEWAWVNRYLGWFVLLCYGATGALIVRTGNTGSVKILLRTYTSAVMAIAVLELLVSALYSLGIRNIPLAPFEIAGFAQNHNLFGFQLLMAIAAVCAAFPRRLIAYILTPLLAAIWLSNSLSTLLTLPFLCGVILFYRRDVLWPLIVSIALAGAINVVIIIPQLWIPPDGHALTTLMPRGNETSERIGTWLGAWELFKSHPLFGSGLGAYRSQMNISADGVPLVIHSTPLWLLAETGIVGFAVFSISAIGFLYKAATERAYMLVACIIIMGAMSQPADMLYQRTFWLIAGACLTVPMRRHLRP
jgi:O-antigen ligase/uncharacterized membrane protein YbhN (UPF0104 family)